jgi:hypothetical protein
MPKKVSVAEELKALGMELASAFKQARDSQEFKALERDITSSVKKVSSSLVKSLKAANKSQEAGRLKNRVGRVVKISTTQGEAQARKAAKAGMEKFNKAFKTLAAKIESRRNA